MLQADSQTPKDKHNQNNSIKFETESIKSSLCDYFDVFVLAIIIQTHQEVYGSFKEMKFQITMLIFLLIIISYSNKKHFL